MNETVVGPRVGERPHDVRRACLVQSQSQDASAREPAGEPPSIAVASLLLLPVQLRDLEVGTGRRDEYLVRVADARGSRRHVRASLPGLIGANGAHHQQFSQNGSLRAENSVDGLNRHIGSVGDGRDGGCAVAVADEQLLRGVEHAVLVLEKDRLQPAPDLESAASTAFRVGAPQIVQPHAIMAKCRQLLLERLPDVYADLLTTGVVEASLNTKPPGPPTTRILANLDEFTVGIWGGDNDTMQLAIAPLIEDRRFRVLKHAEVFTSVLRTLPTFAAWLEALEPISGVFPMAGLHNTLRRLVVDGAPVVTGLHAIGDSVCTTNPTLGRGLSLALWGAIDLVDSMQEHGEDWAAQAVALDGRVAEHVVPFYADQASIDFARLACFGTTSLALRLRRQMEFATE